MKFKMANFKPNYTAGIKFYFSEDILSAIQPNEIELIL